MLQKELMLMKQVCQLLRCHYWYFKDVGFKFDEHVCKRCHNLLTTVYGLQNTAKLSTTFKRSYF